MTPLNVDQFMKASCSPSCEPVRPPLTQDQQAGAGFSQVDLLTMLGSLAILGLLLTPALARTRVTDQGFQCRNNLRQIIGGWQMYAEENSGYLPNCFDWVGGWLTYGTNNADNTNILYLINGLLGPYVNNPAVYKCPADQSRAMEGGVSFPRARTVSMSQSFSAWTEGHLEDGGSPPGHWRHYLKAADMVLPAPANLWVLIDENPDSVNDCAFGVSMNTTNKWLDAPSTLHDGVCGIAFADGHFETKKWADPRTLALNVTYTTTSPHVLPQPNNCDIKWVQNRTTAPK